MKYSTAAWVTAANTTSKRTMMTDENIIPTLLKVLNVLNFILLLHKSHNPNKQIAVPYWT